MEKELLYEALSLLDRYMNHALLKPEKQVSSKEVRDFIRRVYDHQNSGEQFTPRY